jgi:hypothetical protein
MHGPASGPFRRKKVLHGSEYLPGIAIRCGYEKCDDASKEAAIYVNRFQGIAASEDTQELRFIQHKYEAMGWKFGRTVSEHRCPKCFAAIKATAARRASEKRAAAANGEQPVASVTPIKTLNDIGPRKMERDDRRIIYEKLREVYVNDKVGYGEGWTDVKVAADLGVPHGWVKLIRDENFGDENANEEIKHKVAEAIKKLAEAKEVFARAEPIWADFKRLNNEIEHLAKSLDVIRRSVGA